MRNVVPRRRGRARGEHRPRPGRSNSCPSGYRRITADAECRAAHAALGSVGAYQGSEKTRNWPRGCYFCATSDKACSKGAWRNRHRKGKGRKQARLFCAAEDSSYYDYDSTPEPPDGNDLVIGDSDLARWGRTQQVLHRYLPCISTASMAKSPTWRAGTVRSSQVIVYTYDRLPSSVKAAASS